MIARKMMIAFLTHARRLVSFMEGVSFYVWGWICCFGMDSQSFAGMKNRSVGRGLAPADLLGNLRLLGNRRLFGGSLSRMSALRTSASSLTEGANLRCTFVSGKMPPSLREVADGCKAV